MATVMNQRNSVSKKMKTYTAGVPSKFTAGKEYQLAFANFMPSGRFTFAFEVKEIDVKMLEKHLNCYYDPEIGKDRFRIPISDLVMYMMCVVIPDETGVCYRGQLLKMPDENKEVMILGVDSGLIMKRSIEDLYYIHKKYLMEPFESFACQLIGLEFFISTEILRKTVGANMALFSGNLVGTEMGFSDKLPLFKIRNDEVDVNKALIQYAYDICPGLLPNKDEKKTGSVTHIEPTGEIYIHLTESFIVEMEARIADIDIDKLLNSTNPYKIQDLNKTSIYLAPYEEDGELYRAKFIKTLPNKNDVEIVQVSFIDYGNMSKIPLSQLRIAGLIDQQLERIPPLCHKVYLKWIDQILNPTELGNELLGKTFRIDVRQGLLKGCPVVVLMSEDVNVNKDIIIRKICSLIDRPIT